MAERILTPGQRAQVLAFASRYGPTQAARRFQLPLGTVKSWQARARARAAKAEAWRLAAQAAPTAEPEPDLDELARRMAAQVCLRCGGSGRVSIPAVTRGSLIVRPARRIVCPDCGGPVRHVQVVEHPREDWRQAMAVAGDLGAGWSPDEWALIRSGEVDPDGRRITGRPDA